MKPLYNMIFFVTVFLLFPVFSAHAQPEADSIPQRTYRAARTEVPPLIDGSPVDDCWEHTGNWSDTFVQRQPVEGAPETEETHLKILYDNHYIYVAFRALDSEPEKINRWLAPRDQLLGDAVAIAFDSYDDQRTGFVFVLTAAGTRVDFLVLNDGDDDYTWNAVWEGKTSIDDRGWYAEFRIPLSQLRYSGHTVQQWGMHAIRKIDRKQEDDHLHLIPRNNKGAVFSFGRLEGIEGLPQSRRIELTPYTSVEYQHSEEESLWRFGAGADGKVGLSSDFTLDFTVNPDFGQVEADPSTINLTAYETYYDEKRPFFLEGKNIFGNRGENMFYSRRIGASPQTRIISAVKVSGKSRRGLSLGLLNSLTTRPFTSYSVARLQQDVNKGNTVVGGMLTAVNRSLTGEQSSTLARNAYTGEVDFEQYFRDREFYARGSLQYSLVEGSSQAIATLQRSPVHYFQREGTPHVRVDSSLTRLTGSAGLIDVGRAGGKKWTGQLRYQWASPGFDVNDIGYLEGADQHYLKGAAGYTESSPTSGLLYYYNVFAFYHHQWNYGGVNTFSRAGMETTMNFTNKGYLYFCAFYDLRTVETRMLRGGPPVLINPRWGTDLSTGTDPSRTFWAKLYHGTVLGDQRYAQFAWIEGNYRPVPNLGLALHLNYTYWDKGLEYAGQQDLPSGGKAYLMAGIRQHIAGLTLRADYSITPDLSIQFYGNPFISYGKYKRFKRATNTMDEDYNRRFHLLAGEELTYRAADNTYVANEANGDRYEFTNPDFSFREFRFNLVFRWEYRPNSVLYLVWGQNRSGTAPQYISSFGQNTQALFDYVPANAFMLKFNYWFAL
ncbi:MAG: carbohydrate binding family 9 domain-containing protein [Tannerellaceae bacterium]|jgi:hypothetical protein|nr:carbohydrate binding family 9 domain-containing protein [Tannerellaceae bacterium]